MLESKRIRCGDCGHFPICSKVSVKNVKEDTDFCQWEALEFVKFMETKCIGTEVE